MQFKIEVVYSNGWDDAGWTEETAGVTRPLRFETVGSAQAALDEFLTAVIAAVAAGHMDTKENSKRYRIIAVK